KSALGGRWSGGARPAAPRGYGGSPSVATTLNRLEERLPPKRGADQTRVQRSAGRAPRIKQRLNHKRGSVHEITFDERGRNPQDTKPSSRELPVASRVVSAPRFVARISIDFNHEQRLAGEEVDDMIADND